MALRAKTPSEAFWTLDPKSGGVRPGHEWYVDIESRFDPDDYGLSSKVAKRFAGGTTAPQWVHLGVLGGGGTGKTTQVRAAIQKNASLVPVWVDSLASFDVGDFKYSEFLLVLVRSVLERLAKLECEIPSDEAELIRLWFAEELLTETHRKEIAASVETDASASHGIPFLAKLTAKFTARLRSDNEYRTEIRKRADKDPLEILTRTNALLDAARESIETKFGTDHRLVVVFDNLEKISNRSIVDAEVLRRAEEIRQLRCHLVLFLHSADQYAPISVAAAEAFDVLTAPVLPIRTAKEKPEVVSSAVEAVVRELIERRVEPSVFENFDEIVHFVASCSGGRIRDVFHIVRVACDRASAAPVTIDHVKKAVDRLGAYRSSLARSDEDWETLARIHREKRIVNNPINGFLLLHSLVLSYNGVPWWDVHPLIMSDERFVAAFNKDTAIRKR